MMDDAIVFKLIAQNRLPRADALDAMGRPCFRIPVLLDWLGIDMADFLGVLPTRIEGRQYPEVIHDLAEFASIEE